MVKNIPSHQLNTMLTRCGARRNRIDVGRGRSARSTCAVTLRRRLGRRHCRRGRCRCRCRHHHRAAVANRRRHRRCLRCGRRSHRCRRIRLLHHCPTGRRRGTSNSRRSCYGSSRRRRRRRRSTGRQRARHDALTLRTDGRRGWLRFAATLQIARFTLVGTRIERYQIGARSTGGAQAAQKIAHRGVAVLLQVAGDFDLRTENTECVL